MSKIKFRAIDYLWRSWIETINRCKNNPGNSSTIKVSEHIDVYKGIKIAWKGFVHPSESKFINMKKKIVGIIWKWKYLLPL